MSKEINNLNTINQKNLLYLHNKGLRILKRQKKINYLDSLFNPPQLISINTIKSSFNNKKKQKSKDKENKKVDFPIINTSPNKTLSVFDKMKNYKVLFKKKKKKVI